MRSFLLRHEKSIKGAYVGLAVTVTMILQILESLGKL